MTKISIYNIDDKVLGNDKWIGSDAQNHYATKNFTPTKLAAYFNENQVIDVGAPIRYRYDILEIGDSRLPGTITFNPQVGTPYSFSNISTFLLSKYTLKGNDVTEYLNFLIGTKVLFSKSNDINIFGCFKVVDIEEYLPEPNFFQVTLEYLTGNGSIEEDRDYLISLIDISTGDVELPTLDQVTTAGNTTDNSIVLTNPYSPDYTLTNTLTSLNSYFTFVSPTQTEYTADYAGYGIMLNNQFEGIVKDVQIYDGIINLNWNNGTLYSSVLNEVTPLWSSIATSYGAAGNFSNSTLKSGNGYSLLSLYKSPTNGGSISVSNLNGIVDLEFPDKPAGTYTISTTDDIPTNIVEGTFTSGTIPIANGINSLTDSKIKFVGTWNSNTFTFASNVGIINSYTGLEVEALEESRLELISGGGFSANLFNSYGGVGLRLDDSLSTNFIFYYDGYDPLNRYLLFQSNEEERLRLTHNGNIMMGSYAFNSSDNGVDKLQVNGSIKSTAIRFDLAPISVPTTESTMSWNNSDGTLDLKLKGGNVTLQIGQETVMRVVNKTVTNIDLLESNYQVVRLTGAQGQRPKVDLALAVNDANSAETLGLVTENIANNQEGFITTSGIVRNINTTGSLQGETWIDGDILYVSGTIAGQLTNIKPISPIHLVIVGYVIYAHINNGKIFVKVDNGYELQELHNVSTTAPNNNEVLTYNTTTSLWEPKEVINLLPEATAVDNGYLSATDWGTFNNKANSNTELNIRRTGYTVYNEFLSSISNGSYALATVATGTITTATGNVDANHFGVVTFNSSATANSGFYSALNPSATVHFSCTLVANLQTDLIFKTPAAISPTTVLRFGVGSGSITSVEYTNGFYFEILANQLVGKTANLATRSSTAAYTINVNTWYHLRVKVTSTTLITYFVYDMDGALLFSATLATNLPSLTVVMNQSVIVTNSAGLSLILGYFDYMSITFPPMIRGALN